MNCHKETLERAMCKPNKHLHEKLTQQPHLSAAPGRQPCQGASNFLPNQRQFTDFKIKERRKWGGLSGQWFIHGAKETLSPPKMLFFLGPNPSIFPQPGNLRFSPPCIFQWFPLLHDTGSPQSALCNLRGVVMAQSIFLLPNSELMLCLSWKGDQLFPTSKAFPQLREGPWATQPENWHLKLAMSSL